MIVPRVRLKLAKRIKEIRNRKGLTQEQAALRCKLDLRDYQRLESLKPPALRIDTLDRIAKGLRVSLQELFEF